MFKLLLIQKWHNLSDPGLEEALYDRSSFIFFSGFSLISSLPDHSTICRFRNALLELNIYEKLFGEINRQLESNGMMVKEGAIVDATIIESSRRPRKVTELMPEDRHEEKSEMPAPVVTYSDDPDANWIKKGKRAYYGYKGHITVDAKVGFIPGGHVTPASTADITELERIVNESGIPEGSLEGVREREEQSHSCKQRTHRRHHAQGLPEQAAHNRTADYQQAHKLSKI